MSSVPELTSSNDAEASLLLSAGSSKYIWDCCIPADSCSNIPRWSTLPYCGAVCSCVQHRGQQQQHFLPGLRIGLLGTSPVPGDAERARFIPERLCGTATSTDCSTPIPGLTPGSCSASKLAPLSWLPSSITQIGYTKQEPEGVAEKRMLRAAESNVRQTN